MMGWVKWIKIKTDIFDDDKTKMMFLEEKGTRFFVIWIRLLTMAGKVNDNGMIYLTDGKPYTPKMFSTLWGEDEKTIKEAVEFFREYNMIKIKNGIIIVKNWEKNQSLKAEDRTKELRRIRQAKYRARQKGEEWKEMKLMPVNVAETKKEEGYELTEKEISKLKEYTDSQLEIRGWECISEDVFNRVFLQIERSGKVLDNRAYGYYKSAIHNYIVDNADKLNEEAKSKREVMNNDQKNNFPDVSNIGNY